VTTTTRKPPSKSKPTLVSDRSAKPMVGGTGESSGSSEPTTEPVPRDQQMFAGVLAALTEHLERVARQRATPTTPTAQAAQAAGFAPTIPAASALARLIAAFELSAFETAILLLAAAAELQPGVAQLCANLGDTTRPWPSFGLAIACLPKPHWSATLPEAPLRGHRLLVLGEGEVLTERALRIDERVLHALLGHDQLDVALARRLVAVAIPREVAPSLRDVVPRVAASLHRSTREHVQLITGEPARGIALAAVAAASAGLRPWRLDAAMIPAEANERDELARLWQREAKLAPVVLLLVIAGGSPPGHEFLVADFARRLAGPRVIISAEPPFEPDAIRIDVDEPTFDDRVELWRAALAERAERVAIDRLAAQFSLGPEAIREAARQIDSTSVDLDRVELQLALWTACRAYARPRMAELAQRVEARATLDEVVLPDTARKMLEALVSQVRARARVHYGWGFDAQSGRGSGTAAVFAGPSGTGKTMAAEALANALALDLFRIDLSAVVSKYIGETEENLRKVFDAAEAGGAVLLFDEADALFGKRTEVRDSHDRHANIEVSYLLQRMEAYRGLAILTTNMRKAIDDAFLRRVQFIIDFPFPDAEQRERIWARIFPSQAPLGPLDLARLAKLAVAGGNIRSIARNAAYLAADVEDVEHAEPRIEMKHLLAAARIEYAKLGRSLPPSDIRGWVGAEEFA
jgi:AAA+ superfamily predicted ATPase